MSETDLPPEGGSQDNSGMTEEQVERQKALREYLRSVSNQGGAYGLEGQFEPETPEHEPEHELETDIETGQYFNTDSPAESAADSLAEQPEGSETTTKEPKTEPVDQDFLDRPAKLADSDDEFEEPEPEQEQEPEVEPEIKSTAEATNPTVEPAEQEAEAETQAESAAIDEDQEKSFRQIIEKDVANAISQGEGESALKDAYSALHRHLGEGRELLQRQLSYKIKELITKDAVQGVDKKAKAILTAIYMTRLSPRQAAAAAQLTLFAAEKVLERSGQEGGIQGLTDRLVDKLQEWQRSGNDEERALAETGLEALRKAEEEGADEGGDRGGPQGGSEGEGGPQGGEGQQGGEGTQEGENNQEDETDENDTVTLTETELPRQSDSIFIERLDVSSDIYNYRAIHSRTLSSMPNFDANNEEDRRRVDDQATKLALEDFHRDFGIEVKIINVGAGATQRPVYFIEFNLLSERDCVRFCGDHRAAPGLRSEASQSLIGKLTLDDKLDMFTREELRVLRTFDIERRVKVREHETDLLAEYFQIESSDNIDQARVGKLYAEYRDSIQRLVHTLNAYATEEDPKAGRQRSTEEQIADQVHSQLPKIRQLAGNLRNVRVSIWVSETVVGDTRVAQGATREAFVQGLTTQQLSRSEWRRKDNIPLDDAFYREIRPIIDSISKVVRKANTANEYAYDPAKSLDDIVRLSEGVGTEEVAYVLRSNPLIDRAMQAYMIGLQRSGAECFRIVQPNFGEIDPESGLEPAQRDAIALLIAEEVERKIQAGESFDWDQDIRQIRYAVVLASGLHKYHTGEFWNYLGAITEGEVATGTSVEIEEADDGQRRVRASQQLYRAAPQNGLVKKMIEMSSVEAEMYGGDRTAGVYGIPAPRYPGLDPRYQAQSAEVPRNADEYLMMNAEFRTARREGYSEERRFNPRELRKRFLFLRDILRKPAGDVLMAGGWRNPQLRSLVDRKKAELGAERMQTLDGFGAVIASVEGEWGARGVIDFIENELDEMMGVDPDYAEALKAADERKKAEASAVSRNVSRFLRKTPNAVQRRVARIPMHPEYVRKLKDEARAKYLENYVYKPLLDRNPAMALLLEHRAHVPAEQNLLRVKMISLLREIMLQQPDMRDRAQSVDEMQKLFRQFETVLHYEYRRVAKAQVRATEQPVDAGDEQQETQDREDERINGVIRAVARQYGERDLSDRELQWRRDQLWMLKHMLTAEIKARKLPAQFAEAHALGLGSYNAQLSAPEVVYSKYLSHHLINPLADLKAQTDIKKLEGELFGKNGELKKLAELTDLNSIEAAAGQISEKITDLVDKLTLNPVDAMRLKGAFVVIIAKSLIDPTREASVYQDNAGFLIENKKLKRDILIYEMCKRLGIPEQDYIQEGGKVVLLPISATSILSSFGTDYDFLRNQIDSLKRNKAK